eukprot:maker-scaffold361_size196684-snap-gene-0.24 protein:Tk09272 transcript:maker-scaffold361_size196684-snap-gene-0.24-mRNA-1 annotation:"low quality protein: zinc finger protein 64"
MLHQGTNASITGNSRPMRARESGELQYGSSGGSVPKYPGSSPYGMTGFQSPAYYPASYPQNHFGYGSPHGHPGAVGMERQFMTPLVPDEELSSMLQTYLDSSHGHAPPPAYGGPMNHSGGQPRSQSSISSTSTSPASSFHGQSPSQQSVDSGFGGEFYSPSPNFQRTTPSHPGQVMSLAGPVPSGDLYSNTNYFRVPPLPSLVPGFNQDHNHNSGSHSQPSPPDLEHPQPTHSSLTRCSYEVGNQGSGHATSEASPLSGAQPATRALGYESPDQDLSLIVDQVLDSIDEQFSPPVGLPTQRLEEPPRCGVVASWGVPFQTRVPSGNDGTRINEQSSESCQRYEAPSGGSRIGSQEINSSPEDHGNNPQLCDNCGSIVSCTGERGSKTLEQETRVRCGSCGMVLEHNEVESQAIVFNDDDEELNEVNTISQETPHKERLGTKEEPRTTCRNNPFDRSTTSVRPRAVAVARPLVKVDQSTPETTSQSSNHPNNNQTSSQHPRSDGSGKPMRTVGVVEPRVVVKIPWARVKDLPSKLDKAMVRGTSSGGGDATTGRLEGTLAQQSSIKLISQEKIESNVRTDTLGGERNKRGTQRKGTTEDERNAGPGTAKSQRQNGDSQCDDRVKRRRTNRKRRHHHHHHHHHQQQDREHEQEDGDGGEKLGEGIKFLCKSGNGTKSRRRRRNQEEEEEYDADGERTFQLTAELPEHFKLALQERMHVPKELLNVYLEHEVGGEDLLRRESRSEKVETSTTWNNNPPAKRQRKTKLTSSSTTTHSSHQGPWTRQTTVPDREQPNLSVVPTTNDEPADKNTHQVDIKRETGKRKRSPSMPPSSHPGAVVGSSQGFPHDVDGIKINPLKLIRRYVPGTRHEEYKIEPEGSDMGQRRKKSVVDLLSDEEEENLPRDSAALYTYLKQRVPYLNVTRVEEDELKPSLLPKPVAQAGELKDMRVVVKRLSEQAISLFMTRGQVHDEGKNGSLHQPKDSPPSSVDLYDSNSWDSLSSEETDMPAWNTGSMKGFDELRSEGGQRLLLFPSSKPSRALPGEQKSVNSSRQSRLDHFHQYRAQMSSRNDSLHCLVSPRSDKSRSQSRGTLTPTFGVVPPPQTWNEKTPFTTRTNMHEEQPNSHSLGKEEDINTVANTLHTLLQLDEPKCASEDAASYSSSRAEAKETLANGVKESGSASNKRDIEGKAASDKEGQEKASHLNAAPISDKDPATTTTTTASSSSVQTQQLSLDSTTTFMEGNSTDANQEEASTTTTTESGGDATNEYALIGADSESHTHATRALESASRGNPGVGPMATLASSAEGENLNDSFIDSLSDANASSSQNYADLFDKALETFDPANAHDLSELTSSLPTPTNTLSMPILFNDDNANAIHDDDLSSILAYPTNTSTIDLNQLSSTTSTTIALSATTTTNSSHQPTASAVSVTVSSPSSDKENEGNAVHPKEPQQDGGKCSSQNNDDEIVCLTPLGPEDELDSKIARVLRPEPNRIGRPRRYYKSIEELEQKAIVMLQKRNHNLMNLGHDDIIAQIKAELTNANDASVASGKQKAAFIHEPIQDSKWLYCPKPKCNFWTRKERRIERHLRSHIPESKAFRCPDCSVRFYSLPKMLSHDRKFHTGDKDYECKICEAEVTDISVHMRIHRQEKDFSCDICPLTFRHKNSLVRHLVQHSGERPFRCQYCDASFAMAVKIRDHVKKKHPNMPLHVNERGVPLSTKNRLLLPAPPRGQMLSGPIPQPGATNQGFARILPDLRQQPQFQTAPTPSQGPVTFLASGPNGSMYFITNPAPQPTAPSTQYLVPNPTGGFQIFQAAPPQPQPLPHQTQAQPVGAPGIVQTFFNGTPQTSLIIPPNQQPTSTAFPTSTNPAQQPIFIQPPSSGHVPTGSELALPSMGTPPTSSCTPQSYVSSLLSPRDAAMLTVATPEFPTPEPSQEPLLDMPSQELQASMVPSEGEETAEEAMSLSGSGQITFEVNATEGCQSEPSSMTVRTVSGQTMQVDILERAILEIPELHQLTSSSGSESNHSTTANTREANQPSDSSPSSSHEAQEIESTSNRAQQINNNATATFSWVCKQEAGNMPVSGQLSENPRSLSHQSNKDNLVSTSSHASQSEPRLTSDYEANQAQVKEEGPDHMVYGGSTPKMLLSVVPLSRLVDQKPPLMARLSRSQEPEVVEIDDSSDDEPMGETRPNEANSSRRASDLLPRQQAERPVGGQREGGSSCSLGQPEGQDPFQCVKCGRRYKFESFLKVHQRRPCAKI